MSCTHELFAWLDADPLNLRHNELGWLVGILKRNHTNGGSFVENVFGRRIRINIIPGVYPSCSFAE
jgi:hypothetical protein